jgi:hypothetical protein
MADAHDGWRKNIPADFEGRQGEQWDDEIDTSFAYKTAILIAVSVALSFVLCWALIKGLEAWRDKPESPIAEANLRQLPPTPVLQSAPEAELTGLRQEMGQRLHGFGWTDQLDHRVYIPVDRAMDLVLQGHPRIGVEPAAERPVDVPAPTAAPAAPTPAPHAPAGGH